MFLVKATSFSDYIGRVVISAGLAHLQVPLLLTIKSLTLLATPGQPARAVYNIAAEKGSQNAVAV